MAARRPIALTWNWCRSSHLSRLVTAAPSSIGSRQIEQQGFSLSSRGKADRGVIVHRQKKIVKRMRKYNIYPPQLHPSPLVCPPPSPSRTHVEIDSENSPHRSARDLLRRLDPRPSRINKGLHSLGAAGTQRLSPLYCPGEPTAVLVTTHYPVSSRSRSVYIWDKKTS